MRGGVVGSEGELEEFETELEREIKLCKGRTVGEGVGVMP